ncbi:MAG: class I SAM-dependent methyltransferase [Terricaulis sp.]
MKSFEVVTRWLKVDSGPAASAELVGLMTNLFSAYISVPELDIARRNALVYTLGLSNRDQRGWLEMLLFGSGEIAAEGRMAVLATIDPPRALTQSALNDIDSLVHDTGAGLVAIATTTPQVLDPALIDRLRSMRKIGTEVLLFDWADIGLSVAAKALSGRPQVTMLSSRVRALHMLNFDDERFIVKEDNRSKWLASRALPSLNTVIDGLPKARMVFDLGAGYGRHTMAASIAGHDVLAVERKASVCECLRLDLESLPRGCGMVTVTHLDYLDVSPETAGLADLVICTGVLQHARSTDDLQKRIEHLATLAGMPSAIVYIEMLFDMLFDGRAPSDGRLHISIPQFEDLLRAVFPAARWIVQRIRGPTWQSQLFDGNGRSFDPPARTIESTSAEYLIQRHE